MKERLGTEPKGSVLVLRIVVFFVCVQRGYDE